MQSQGQREGRAADVAGRPRDIINFNKLTKLVKLKTNGNCWQNNTILFESAHSFQIAIQTVDVQTDLWQGASFELMLDPNVLQKMFEFQYSTVQYSEIK